MLIQLTDLFLQSSDSLAHFPILFLQSGHSFCIKINPIFDSLQLVALLSYGAFQLGHIFLKTSNLIFIYRILPVSILLSYNNSSLSAQSVSNCVRLLSSLSCTYRKLCWISLCLSLKCISCFSSCSSRESTDIIVFSYCSVII